MLLILFVTITTIYLMFVVGASVCYCAAIAIVLLFHCKKYSLATIICGITEICLLRYICRVLVSCMAVV